jgi:hypothetical protein
LIISILRIWICFGFRYSDLIGTTDNWFDNEIFVGSRNDGLLDNGGEDWVKRYIR